MKLCTYHESRFKMGKISIQFLSGKALWKSLVVVEKSQTVVKD